MKSMLRIALAITFFVLCLEGFSQDKLLTLKDITYLNRAVFPKSLPQLQWMGDTEKFAYVENNALIVGKANTTRRDTLIRIDDLNTGLHALEKDSIRRMPRLSCLGDQLLMFTHLNGLYLYDTRKKELRNINSFNSDARNIDIDRTTFQVAYTVENNLFVALEGNPVQITNDENKGIINGQTVHRNEFGIHKGTFWSPEGNYLAFYQMDESMVTQYPNVDITTRFAELDLTRYPMAGMTSHEVKVGIYNVQTGQLTFVKTGGPVDQYLTNITWGPDEKYLYIAMLNRDQNYLKLNQYEVATGNYVKTLFEEISEKYVEPEHGLYFMASHTDRFVWYSERDGYNHLYLYNTNGELLKQLTQGDWVVTSFYGFDQKGSYAYFQANRENPVQKDIYAVSLESNEVIKLTNLMGTHTARFCESKRYFIDIFSSTEVARKYQVMDRNGKPGQILIEDVNPLAAYRMGDMSIFTIKNKQGTDLYCRLIKPPNFDEGKKYPAIVYVYGGPHSQLVTNSWLGGGQMFLYYLALQGYVVFTLDNRGTNNRGFDFESDIFRQIGVAEVEDQMCGVEYLKSLPYIDTDLIGVDGWSYGGFLTITMLVDHPDAFKVGVAGGPVIDWKFYEVMYGERYMDTPEANPEGYEKISLLNKAHQLQDQLLIIQGGNDPTVVSQNSLSFVKKCIDEGVQVDYFIYPGHGHNVRGVDRMHLYEKITAYFNTYLK